MKQQQQISTAGDCLPLMASLYVFRTGNANSELCWPGAPRKHLITPGPDSAAPVSGGGGAAGGVGAGFCWTRPNDLSNLQRRHFGSRQDRPRCT